jgi:GNAT superfamily N-acetyltransferase
MRIQGFDPVSDTGALRACHALFASCRPVDDPAMPEMSLPVFSGWFSMGWDYCPREAWMVPGTQDGTPAAWCLLELPGGESKNAAPVSITVAPGERRRGIGTALLRNAARRAARRGRTVLAGETRQDVPGSAFAAAAGARPGLTAARRVLDLAEVTEGLLRTLRGQAEKASVGYSLLSWQGPCPQEYLDQVAAVQNAFADAPHSPGEEPQQVTGLRVRQNELRTAAQGLRQYTVAARHDGTGQLAALTQLSVDPLEPAWGFQELTAVDRAHRGHRLGLLVKVAMLDLLGKAEPGLRHIHTGNADANRHMIAINDALGFRVLDRILSWQLDVRPDGTIGPQPASGQS